MKRVSLIMTVIFLLTSIGGVAQEAPPLEKITIVNGYFFRNIPEAVTTNMAKPNAMRIYMISTPNGTKVIGIKLSESLSDEALRDTIPMAEVPEAAELLRRFEEVQARSKGRRIVQSPKAQYLEEGDRFPEFSVTDIDGRTWSSTDVKGKVMVLNVWFTGCRPCLAEMPELSAWKDEMPEVMFFSSTFESADVALPVIKNRGFNWIPIVNDSIFDKHVGRRGYPLTVVVDKEGIVAAVEHGTSPSRREDLRQKIKSLISD